MTKVKHESKKLSDADAFKAWQNGETFVVIKSDELPKGTLIDNGDTYLVSVIYDPEDTGFGSYLA